MVTMNDDGAVDDYKDALEIMRTSENFWKIMRGDGQWCNIVKISGTSCDHRVDGADDDNDDDNDDDDDDNGDYDDDDNDDRNDDDDDGDDDGDSRAAMTVLKMIQP